MNKKFRFRAVLINILLATALIFGIVSSGHSNECGPNLGRLTGRPLYGLFSAALVTPAGATDPIAVAYLRVECRDGSYLDLGPAIDDYVEGVAWGTYIQQDLEDICIPGEILLVCGSGIGGAWAVSRVNQWIKTGSTMSAEVVLQEEVLP